MGVRGLRGPKRYAAALAQLEGTRAGDPRRGERGMGGGGEEGRAAEGTDEEGEGQTERMWDGNREGKAPMVVPMVAPMVVLTVVVPMVVLSRWWLSR